MKKTFLPFKLLTLLFFSFLVVSCGDDDEDEVPALNNEIEYENNRSALGMGLYFDLGPINLFGKGLSHHGQGFILTDAKDFTSEPKFLLQLYLLSAGTAGFTTGSFEMANFQGLSATQAETKYKTKNIFLESGLMLDLNSDAQFDEDTESFMIRSGTINVSGTAPNYTVEVDAVLTNDKPLKAKFTGEFTPITPDEEEEAVTGDLSNSFEVSALKTKAPSVFRNR